MREPPKPSVCSPGRLFRVLSAREPRWSIDYRPPGLEHFRLEARGLSSHEADDFLDELDRHERDKRVVLTTLELVSLALVADGQRAFQSADEVGDLPSYVIAPLARAVHEALAICSPLYGRTDHIAWSRVLRDGANKNDSIAVALGGAVDAGQRTTERPDRYFGRPLCELTDGQWMAFRASRAFLESLTPKSPTAASAAREIQTMTTTPEHVSAFAKAIAERHANRKVHAFQIDGFFGLGDKPIPEVGIRVPTKREEVAALDQAYKLVKDLCSQEEARADGDILADLKAACIAFQACRDVSNPKYPAFPGPEWMYKHLTGDQIGSLLNLMNQVRVAESPAPVDVSDAQVEAWVTVCAAAAGSEIPSHQLAGVPREYLVYLVTAMSEKLTTERAHTFVLAKAAAEAK